MLVTEKEASQKECILPSGNNGNCIGCKCMGWRWASDDFDGYRYEDDTVKIKHLGERRTGYCGLAGNPTECD